ncbi:MAG: hypothetical protein WCI22_03460 [Actinomycetota bacterium]
MSATATCTHRIHTGDVIEIDLDEQSVTALVLLATHEMVILDPCDGRTPIVVRTEELGGVRVFDPSQF